MGIPKSLEVAGRRQVGSINPRAALNRQGLCDNLFRQERYSCRVKQVKMVSDDSLCQALTKYRLPYQD